jgi:hypothetical protein
MGAWGHRSFENDSALDWFGDLDDEGASPVQEILDAVGGAGDDDYVEVDDASAALAAAELVAAALGKGDDRLDEDAAAWLAGHRDAVRAIGADRARRAVERVFANSELRELWGENGDDTDWHVDVRALIARLA